jgi:hypothetical protein
VLAKRELSLDLFQCAHRREVAEEPTTRGERNLRVGGEEKRRDERPCAGAGVG